MTKPKSDPTDTTRVFHPALRDSAYDIAAPELDSWLAAGWLTECPNYDGDAEPAASQPEPPTE